VTTEMTHEEAASYLGAFAVHAVEPSEARAVSDHLVECPICRDELANLREAAAMLGNLGGEAPVRLWDSISARIDRPPSPRSSLPEPSLVSLDSARSRRNPASSLGMKVVSIAASVAILAVGVLGVEDWRLNQRLGRVAAASRSANLATAARQAALDPSARLMPLVATSGNQRKMVGELVVEPSGETFFFNRSMAPLPPDRTYQLWEVRNGEAISVGVLGSRPSTLALSFQPGTGSYALAMTVEPAGGSPAPTGRPVAASA
jgi:anti-sigma-K factor RskA